MKLVLGLFALLIIIALGIKFIQDNPIGNPLAKNATAKIKNQTFKLSVAKTAKDKEVGLSEKKSLPNDSGMIFPFGRDGYYSFWMKNMKFPIDIIFINDNKIVKIHHSVQPPKDTSDSLSLYSSDSPSDTVLEIKAGLSKKYGFKEGDKIELRDIESPK